MVAEWAAAEVDSEDSQDMHLIALFELGTKQAWHFTVSAATAAAFCHNALPLDDPSAIVAVDDVFALVPDDFKVDSHEMHFSAEMALGTKHAGQLMVSVFCLAASAHIEGTSDVG